MRKLKIYQAGLLISLGLLIALNIYFIVRTALLFQGAPSIEDLVLLTVALVVLLVILVLDFVNTIYSKKNGSTFIKALAFNNDREVNTKFIVFCYFFGVISIGVIIYFLFVLNYSELPFGKFPTPFKYLIINLFSLTLLISIAVILFPYMGRSDPAFKIKQKKRK